MWLSCLSSLSSTSSSSKVTRLALKRDFFGGAGVKDGSWSGRSTAGVKVKPRSSPAEGQANGRVFTLNGDNIPLLSLVLSLGLSLLASPLVRPSDHRGCSQGTRGQKLLLFSQEVSLGVCRLRPPQHPSWRHIIVGIQQIWRHWFTKAVFSTNISGPRSKISAKLFFPTRKCL